MAVSDAPIFAPTRATLLLKLREDGPARELAWAEFCDIYGPIIGGFARRLGATLDEADDLVQDVMRAFFTAVPEFVYDPGRGRFRGYLKACVWHKLAELRRRRAVEPRSNAGALQLDDKAADEAWEDVWETEKLHRALAAVQAQYAGNAERQRSFRAFEMCVLLDCSALEVARALDMNEESVRAAKSRVSKALRKQFDLLEDSVG